MDSAIIYNRERQHKELNRGRWKVAQWFELRWWKRYLRNKNKEEYLAWKKNYWSELLSRINDVVKIEAQTLVADLGCGPAGVFIALPNNHLTAVDPLLGEYEKQIAFFNPADHSNTQFINGTIEEFNGEEKFDVAFCMNAINHVHDIEMAFHALSSSVKTGGRIVISVDAHNYSMLVPLFRALQGDILHPHQYNLKGYEQLIEKNGMKILKTVLLKSELIFNHYLIVAAK